MNLGSLFVPEAYITATRQYVAQANSWSLEELYLEVNVTSAQGAALDACSFGIKGESLGRPERDVTVSGFGRLLRFQHVLSFRPQV